MNLSEARDELRARGFDGLTDARCNHFLNAAQTAIDDAAPWPWLEASTSGTAPLTVSDLKAVQHVWNTGTDCSLQGADRRFLRDTFGPDIDTTGTAEWWYLEGLTTLSVYPADTSSTFEVDYIKHSPELTTDGQEPLFPERMHQLWIDLATVEAYMDSDEPQMAQVVQARADVRLAREIGVYFGRNMQNAEYQTITFASEDW